MAMMALSTLQVLAVDPTHRDIEFATVGEHSLKLDLYLPKDVEKPPLIVWVHGGAWRKGSRASVPIQSLTERGFAIASVDYRLSPVAKFPAQVIDIREAIEFLAANSAELNLAQDRLAIAGASAGGHWPRL